MIVDTKGQTPVRITNINIPFWALVGLILKIYFAWVMATVSLALFGGAFFLLGTIVLSMFAK